VTGVQTVLFRSTKTDKKNIVDMGSFTIQDLVDFDVKYDTLYVDEENVITKFPRNFPLKS
jgi:hypothetical protein